VLLLLVENITALWLKHCCHHGIAAIKIFYHHLYGIALWGNSIESVKVFKLQKRAIRLMTGTNGRTSCRPLFAMLGIMTLPSQYVFSDGILVSKPGVLYS